MRVSRKMGLLAAVFGSGLVAFAAMPAAAETLADAIALAYATNPTILSQRSLLRISDETYYVTNRALGPTVSVGATITGATNNDLNDNGEASSSAGLSADIIADQTIYSGGRLRANLAAQEATLKAARESLRRVEMQVLENVVEAYTAVRRAERSLTITNENVAVLMRQRDEAQARFEVGASTRTDVAQAESRLAQARGQLTAAQNTLDNARAQYRTVVGRSPEQLAPEPALGAYLPASQAIAFQIAELNSPILRAAYLEERSSAARISAARAARRPTITISTGVGYRQDNPAFGAPSGFGDSSNDLTTAARVSIPLYSGLTTSSTIRSAIEANRGDNINIESERRNLDQSVTVAWNALVSAHAQIISQQEAVRAASLAFEGTREEQQVGLRTTLDLLNAEQELRTAQLNLVNAQFSEYTAQTSLLNAMGKLTPETFGAQVDTYDPKKHFNDVNDFGLPWEPVVKTIDSILAAPIPQRQPMPGENVPTFEPLR